MLALHGFAGSGADFDLLARACDEHAELSWIAPDLPGHGATGCLPDVRAHTLPAMAEVLSMYVARLPAPPTVLGYSMGGRLALAWLLGTGPTPAALVLVGATPGLISSAARDERRRSDAGLADELRRSGVEEFAERWEAQPLIASQARLPAAAFGALRGRRRRQSAKGLAQSLEHAGTGTMSDLWSRLAEFTAPTLCVAGESDVKFTSIAQRMAHLFPKGRCKIVARAGHCAHLENFRAFAAIFTQFQVAKRLKMT